MHSASEAETIDLGRLLGELLAPGDVLALAGDLGSGKTWFTKGLALGLGVAAASVVTSPSFALVNEYEGRCPLYHMDAYRLNTLADFLAAGLEEYFYLGGVVVLEWGDRWPEILPGEALMIRLAITGPNSREIHLAGRGPRAAHVLESLAACLAARTEV